MNVVIELVKGVALFLWPALIFYVLKAFGHELRAILASIPRSLERMTSAELPGLKVNLQELTEKTLEAAPAVRNFPEPPQSQPPSENSVVETIRANADEPARLGRSMPPTRTILDPAVPVYEALDRGPLDGISKAKIVIANQLKQLMATSGLLKDYAYPEQAARLLAGRNLLPASLADALEAFFTLVNARYEAVEIGSLKSLAIEGALIVRLISEVPRNFHQVVFIDVQLFEDPEGLERDDTAKGVMLRGIDQFNRPSGSVQIFPTTKPMLVGSYVSWEWNMDARWSQRWFLDPSDNEIKTAWDGSAEFVGRDLNALP